MKINYKNKEIGVEMFLPKNKDKKIYKGITIGINDNVFTIMNQGHIELEDLRKGVDQGHWHIDINDVFQYIKDNGKYYNY